MAAQLGRHPISHVSGRKGLSVRAPPQVAARCCRSLTVRRFLGATSEGAAMPSSSAVLGTIPVGMEPRQVTVAPDGKRAYVSLSDLSPSPPLGAVGVIDTGSNTLLATVAVGILPGGVVVAPDGRHAYVPNIQHGGVVSVIDTATNAVKDNITVSVPTSRPLEAAITPDGRELYAAINDASPSDRRGAVTVVDTQQRAVTANVVLTPCEDPAATVITPDGRFVWVLNIGLEGDGPAVFDTTTHEMTFPLRTGIACGRWPLRQMGRLSTSYPLPRTSAKCSRLPPVS
jgi:YVTN family beta-propeller protein